MQKYDAIEQGIRTRDVAALREAIGNICYTCRDLSDGELERIIADVEAEGIKLMDDGLVGKPTISSQKSIFTDDDFSRAVFELKRNFCKERINDIKIIGSSLYKNNSIKNERKDLNTKTKKVSNQVEDTRQKKSLSHQTKKNKWLPFALVAMVILIIILVIMFIQKNKQNSNTKAHAKNDAVSVVAENRV